MAQYISDIIKNRIQQYGAGYCFTATDFADIANNETIRQTLSRLNNIGFIDRLAKGVYYLPRHHNTLGKLPPTIEEVIHAIENAYHIKCQPTGAYAANLLGLSEQVPTQIVFLTDGPSKKIKIGNKKIIFKRTTPKNMITAGSITGLVIQAIKFIGKEHIDSNYLQHLKVLLSTEQIKCLAREAHLAPAWVAKLIKTKLIGD